MCGARPASPSHGRGPDPIRSRPPRRALVGVYHSSLSESWLRHRDGGNGPTGSICGNAMAVTSWRGAASGNGPHNRPGGLGDHSNSSAWRRSSCSRPCAPAGTARSRGRRWSAPPGPRSRRRALPSSPVSTPARPASRQEGDHRGRRFDAHRRLPHPARLAPVQGSRHWVLHPPRYEARRASLAAPARRSRSAVEIVQRPLGFQCSCWAPR